MNKALKFIGFAFNMAAILIISYCGFVLLQTFFAAGIYLYIELMKANPDKQDLLFSWLKLYVWSFGMVIFFIMIKLFFNAIREIKENKKNDRDRQARHKATKQD